MMYEVKETKYIDANALQDVIENLDTVQGTNNQIFLWDAVKAVYDAPAVDVVPREWYTLIHNRLTHLLQSKKIRSFDEWDAEMHCYKRNIANADDELIDLGRLPKPKSEPDPTSTNEKITFVMKNGKKISARYYNSEFKKAIQNMTSRWYVDDDKIINLDNVLYVEMRG